MRPIATGYTLLTLPNELLLSIFFSSSNLALFFLLLCLEASLVS